MRSRKWFRLLMVGAVAATLAIAGCASDGSDGVAGSDGASGVSTLVDVTPEPAGANCTNGGQRIATGVDDDGDGILEVAEVDSTSFVCNGDPSAVRTTATESCSVCHGPGGIRDIGVVHPQALLNNLTFSNISVDTTDLTAVAVTFEVAGPTGPVTNSTGVNFSGRFTFAKLMAGAAAGDQSFWQSYINQVEVGDVGPVEGAPAALAEAVQATYERTSAGTLVHNDALPGQWTYTFAFDFSQVGVTDINSDGNADVPAGTLDFAPGNLNRVSGQFSANEVAVADGDFVVQRELEGNPAFDFVPDGVSTPVPASRDIVATGTCNGCHRELAIHGGHRFEIEYCVTCHNPGSVDANSGNSVDMTEMIHKIHYGENLPSVEAGDAYVIVGHNDSIHDYSTVVWPGFPIGEPMACETCHAQDLMLADALNYQDFPTMESCGSCHDDIDFVAGVGHPFAVTDNSGCGTAGCHVPAGSGLAVVDGHEIFALAEAAKYEASIDTAATTFTAATGELEIVFSIVDPTNANTPWDILADQPFIEPAGASRLAILVGWDPQEFMNDGSGSVPAQPISINALTDAVDNLDGTFSVIATIPAGVDSVRVAIEGHPAVTDPNPPDDPAGTETRQPTRIPMLNAFADINTGAAPLARRAIVDIAKCNGCHGALSLHGNNRTDEIEVCVICHNADATDIDVRPPTLDTTPADGVFDNFAAAGVDGKREESIDFKRMIHAIHAGQADDHGISVRSTGVVVYGFGRSIHDYSHVRYPIADSGLRNCGMCHVGDGPPPLPLPTEVLGTTVRTGDGTLASQAAIDAVLEDSADDLNISPTAAVCSSCHDGGQIQSHMEANGANFGVLQENIQ